MEKNIDVEYLLNLDDIKALNLYYLDHSPHFRHQYKRGRISNLVLMVISFLLALIFWILGGTRMVPLVILMGLLGAYSLVWHLIAPSFRRKRIEKSVDKMYGQGANSDIVQHRFSVTKDKIIDITEMGESSNRWDVVEQVVTTEQHILILLRGAKAYIIPRRAFLDDASFTQFADKAKLYLREAVSQPII
jgi:hypothetical protein